MPVFPRLAALVSRTFMRLQQPRAPLLACILVPLAFGLFSLALGQDRNWDLLNYHLYNPYALLKGRIGTDLAPAQMQSYFNPLLDIPYWLMTQYWPAPLAGFAMGVLHGLAFVLVFGIARRVLVPAGAGQEQTRRGSAVALLLALAGCLGPGYLSELGNTMGDNATALLVLAGLSVLLHGWERLGSAHAAWALAAAAGVLVGAATGLKLTNAIYAVALCAAMLSLPLRWPRRLGLAWVFGLGVLAGIALTAGYWFALMWSNFANPLFPQFNAFFHNTLAAPISVADTRWLPRSAMEAVMFPFVIVADAKRVGEVPTRPFVWPLLYALVCCWTVRAGWRAWRGKPSGADSADLPPLAPQARLVLAFVAAAFLTWLALFSIYRYCVAMELLAPLAVWLVVQRLLPARAAGRTGAIALAMVALAALTGMKTWGHESWARQAFRITLPDVPLDTNTTVFLTGGAVAQGWLATQFPAAVTFAALNSNFPEGPAYVGRVQAMLAERPGQAYALLPANVNWRAQSVARMNDSLAGIGVSANGSLCKMLGSALGRLRVHAQLAAPQPGGEGATCTLAPLPQDLSDLAAEDRAEVALQSPGLLRYGLVLQAEGCRTYDAFIGADARPYQLCPVKLGHLAGSSAALGA
ncbi:hypothetical protein [Cupriavidus basilensis]